MFRKVFGLAVIAALAPAAKLDFNNPTGTQGLIMIDKLGGFVRFFDPVSFKELSSFAIPEGPPHELAISPDHKTAYIPIYGDGVYGRNPHPGHVIAIVDLASKKLTGTIDVSPYQAPHGLQVDSKGTLRHLRYQPQIPGDRSEIPHHHRRGRYRGNRPLDCRASGRR